MNFEVNLLSRFSYTTKKSRQNFKYLENKKSLSFKKNTNFKDRK